MRAFILWIAILLLPTTAAQAESFRTSFSAQATSLTPIFMTRRPQTLPSPDRKSTVVVRFVGRGDAEELVVEVTGRMGRGRFPIAYGPNSELLWSPDSEALFVTVNDGGVVGDYLLKVIGPFGGHLAMRDLTPLVVEAYGHPVRCFDPEEPNVVGIAWLGTSRRLLVAAEIPPHSNCDRMGDFIAFEVDPEQMSITRRVEQPRARSEFSGLLAARLKDDDADCALPTDCQIPMLHPPPGVGPSAAQLSRGLVPRGPRPKLADVRCSEAGLSFYCVYYRRSPSGGWVRWSAYVDKEPPYRPSLPPRRNPAGGPGPP